jgi:hypothetical protein
LISHAVSQASWCRGRCDSSSAWHLPDSLRSPIRSQQLFGDAQGTGAWRRAPRHGGNARAPRYPTLERFWYFRSRFRHGKACLRRRWRILIRCKGMVAQHLAGQVRSCPGRTRAPSYSPRYGGIVGVSPWYLLPLCVAGAPQLLCREPDKLTQKGRP